MQNWILHIKMINFILVIKRFDKFAVRSLHNLFASSQLCFLLKFNYKFSSLELFAFAWSIFD